MTTDRIIPSVSVHTAHTGDSTKANELGMRAMQERAYEKRGEQYLLIKSPPASGKSRALMFIALDKLHNQGVSQAIIVVPERSIGGSFADEPLSRYGFWADWTVKPQWNLCNAPGIDEPRVAKSKVKAVGEFLQSEDRVLVCTHATFRFTVDELGVEAFDGRLIAVDEFHHVSANPDNRLGAQLGQFIARDKVHLVAMTGSYFRGDAVAVLTPEDEARFETVTYTYYEQLNGYEHLKALDIGYYFYTERYLDAIMDVLDPTEKTIVHIPNVNSRESTKDKAKEVNEIMDALGSWEGEDPITGFHLVRRPDGTVLKIADLVEDDSFKRDKVVSALKDPAHRNDRGHVDIIIALGMAKEGFDWIWCEHALTVGYRSSLTEIIQIIGRATRDAPGKTSAQFTNLIAEPDANEALVIDAINDTLKAIAASLLMEQVLAPRFNFTPKNNGPVEGYDYGEGRYDPKGNNVGFDEATGQFHLEINGLVTPQSPEAKRICQEDINEVITAFVQDKSAVERGIFDDETVPQELTQLRMGKIVKDRYPELSESDQEAVRQHAIAALNLTQKAKAYADGGSKEDDLRGNTALIDGVRKFAMDVRDLDIDLIDSINPFEAAYAILAKSMSEATLKQIAAAIASKRINLTLDEARDLARRALKFKQERGRFQISLRRMFGKSGWRKGWRFSHASKPRPPMDELSDKELLEALGVSVDPKKAVGRTPREERVITGFEDIVKFVEEYGRAPEHGENKDIFERLYAVRLERLREQADCRELLADDRHGLLNAGSVPQQAHAEDLDDAGLLAELGVSAPNAADITTLKYVKPREEIRKAEEIANRTVCADFETFKPLFAQVKKDLETGVKETRRFARMAEIKQGEFFIVGGQTAYVAEAGEEFVTDYDRRDSRLRVIYDNGTESDVLLRSLQRALHRDDAGRRITNPSAGPLFGDDPGDEDLESGTIYVLRSKSDHPTITAHRELIHKIGVTGARSRRELQMPQRMPPTCWQTSRSSPATDCIT